MKNKNLIVVCGHAGSGKDTLASFLIDHQNVKFSQPVKDLAFKILGRELNKATDREFIIDLSWFMKGMHVEKFKEKYKDEAIYEKIRRWLEFLHDHNTSTHSVFSETFWAQLVLETKQIAKKSTVYDCKYVFTDIRLPSEYEALKKMNAVFVKLECPKKVCEKRLKQRDGGFQDGIWDSAFEKNFLEWEYDITIKVLREMPLGGIIAYTEKTQREIFQELEQKLNGIEEGIREELVIEIPNHENLSRETSTRYQV